MDINNHRLRFRADWFSITPPDENHDYWFLTFSDKKFKQEVHIEIEDMRKYKETLEAMIVDSEGRYINGF